MGLPHGGSRADDVTRHHRLHLPPEVHGRGPHRRGREGVALNEELEVLRLVTERLETAGFQYMLTGSMALNYCAIPRMTRDIDIVIEVASGDVPHLCDLFAYGFYIDPETVRRSVASRGMFNIIHTEHVVKVDLIMRKDGEFHRQAFARRRRIRVEGYDLFVIAPEDLIVSKLDGARASRSPVQLTDVGSLLHALPDLDRGYVERWCTHMGVADLLREAEG